MATRAKTGSSRRASRAPRREGERTTLRVPEALRATATACAEELGTSTNDALIRLAERGAAIYEAQRQVERLSAERRAAVFAGAGDDEEIELPPPEVMSEAMLAGRRQD